MPQFQYKGTNQQNKAVRGSIEAYSESDCYQRLKKQGIFAHTVAVQDGQMFGNYRLKATELSVFCRQLGSMQASGIPIIRAIDILKERITKPTLLKVYQKLYQYVTEGNTLSEAMRSCGNAFPALLVNMFAAGEANGKLDESAIKMATYYESEHRINTKIRNAMVYPIILAVVTVAVVLLLFTLILPQMFDVIESSGASINGLTAVILAISQLLINQWYLVLLGAILLVMLIIFLVKKNQHEVDRIKLHLPKIGYLLTIIYTARFARTLSSLYGSGVSMIDAVEMSAKTIGNRYMQAQFVQVVQKIRSGQALSAAIEDTDGMDKKLISAIYVGEETGRLDQMLASVSTEYEFESSSAIERMLTFLEPAMLIIMALIIGTVLIGVMLPLMQMYSSIG